MAGQGNCEVAREKWQDFVNLEKCTDVLSIKVASPVTQEETEPFSCSSGFNQASTTILLHLLSVVVLTALLPPIAATSLHTIILAFNRPTALLLLLVLLVLRPQVRSTAQTKRIHDTPSTLLFLTGVIFLRTTPDLICITPADCLPSGLHLDFLALVLASVLLLRSFSSVLA
jgi:hypothetical protein